MCNAAREIAIVGGGLAVSTFLPSPMPRSRLRPCQGLVLALCLNNHGFKPTIYEKQPEDFQQGGAIVLSPNALRVLDSLGLYGKLRVKGYPFEGVLLANNSAVAMGTIFLGSEKRFGFPAMRIARSAIKEVLLEEIECQGIEISYKMALSSLLETNIGVEMKFADGSLVQADLVIGTDGIRSVVREYVDSSCRPYYSGVTLIYGTMKRDHLEEEPLDVTFPSMMLGPEGSFVIVPTDYEGNDVGYFASGLLPDRSREEWTKFRLDKVGLRGNIQERFCNGAWPKTVQRLCREAIPENLLAWP
jgi:2-polyprenyl-6-methoxyphenol hydroxylase-like FAD-dependent oxidoreductase